MTTQKKDWKIMLTELENKLAEFFTKKIPALPENIKEGIVKYGPYLALVGIIFSLSTLLPFKSGSGYIFPLIFGLVIIVLEAMAISGLFKRQMKAWKLMFYVSLISAVSSLSTLDLPGLIVGIGISWYILFQVRSYYK